MNDVPYAQQAVCVAEHMWMATGDPRFELRKWHYHRPLGCSAQMIA